MIVWPEIIGSQVLGDVEISYIGFGDESKENSFYISETLTSFKDYIYIDTHDFITLTL